MRLTDLTNSELETAYRWSDHAEHQRGNLRLVITTHEIAAELARRLIHDDDADGLHPSTIEAVYRC